MTGDVFTYVKQFNKHFFTLDNKNMSTPATFVSIDYSILTIYLNGPTVGATLNAKWMDTCAMG